MSLRLRGRRGTGQVGSCCHRFSSVLSFCWVLFSFPLVCCNSAASLSHALLCEPPFLRARAERRMRDFCRAQNVIKHGEREGDEEEDNAKMRMSITIKYVWRAKERDGGEGGEQMRRGGKSEIERRHLDKVTVRFVVVEDPSVLEREAVHVGAASV